MTVTNQNIKVYRGDTAALHVALTRADGTPYDPTTPGIAIKYRIALSPGGGELVAKDLNDGIVAETGGVAISLSVADSDRRPGL